MTDQDVVHTLRWNNTATGEIKTRDFNGVDTDTYRDGRTEDYEWEISPLEMAVAIVPDLVSVCTFSAGRPVTVTVEAVTSDIFNNPVPGVPAVVHTIPATITEPEALRAVLDLVPAVNDSCVRAVTDGHSLHVAVAYVEADCPTSGRITAAAV